MSRTSTNILVSAISNDKIVIAGAATLLLVIGGLLSVLALGMAALKVVLWFSGAGRSVDEGLTW